MLSLSPVNVISTAAAAAAAVGGMMHDRLVIDRWADADADAVGGKINIMQIATNSYLRASRAEPRDSIVDSRQVVDHGGGWAGPGPTLWKLLLL